MKTKHRILIWFVVIPFISALNSQILRGAVTAGIIQLDRTEWKDYNLSSGSFINSDSEEYTYYDNGKVKTIISSVWDPVNGNWKETEKTFNVYNDTLLSETVNSYLGSNGIWVDTLKKVYTYTNGLKSEVIIYERSANVLPWNESERELLTYDSNGNLIEGRYQQWSILQKDWSDYLIETMTYDAENRITGYVSRVWDFIFGDWVNYDKEVYTYFTNPVSEEYFYYTWNEGTNSWDNYYKDYSEYTADMLTLGFLSWYWDNGVWNDLSKEIHEFDAWNHLIYYAEYDWNNMSKRWDYYDKETYTYDGAGNLTEFVDYDRQTSKNAWIENSRELYSYNTAIVKDMLVLPYSDQSIIDLYFNSQITTTQIYYWDVNSGTWKDDQKGIFQYSDFSVSDKLDGIVNPRVQCYPNPTATSFTVIPIEGQKIIGIELYDMSGKKLESWNYQEQYFYNIAYLSTGSYVVVVRMENAKTFISKLVKN
ncbi:T9SS type A sorting domain-containing protein [Saccharicrinis sp. FJH2]|uniref:T9SS type A sorting domain-containing protein n=1 Tax=Saccharicrinis sp. FJH65 TaxID=3344659 RepID=UPI0035F401D3